MVLFSPAYCPLDSRVATDSARDAVEIDQLLGQVDRHALDLGVVVDHFRALLATKPALLEAAERRFDQAVDPGVDPDIPALDALCQPVRARHVVGPERRRQAV